MGARVQEGFSSIDTIREVFELVRIGKDHVHWSSHVVHFATLEIRNAFNSARCIYALPARPYFPRTGVSSSNWCTTHYFESDTVKDKISFPVTCWLHKEIDLSQQ